MVAGRDVRGVAENLAGRIHHHRTGLYADARVERRLPRTRILAVNLSECALDGEGGPRRAFSIVFLRDRIAEKRH